MIKDNVDYFSVKQMCRLLSVSVSGYYNWRNRPLSPRAKENAELANHIKRIFDEEKSRAGAKRIAKHLKQEGRVRNKNYYRIASDKRWRYTSNLYKEATHKVNVIGNATLAKSNPINCTLALTKNKNKNRKHRNRNGNTT